MRPFLAALLALSALAGAARADVPIPALQARVTDLTGTLSTQQKAELEARIGAFEARRGSQLAVLMLPTTKPEEIEEYSIRLAEAWKIGRKGVDDGLILVVAKDDRRLRIEVGYGLEGAIPDAIAKRVIDERITPRFREGDFYGGVREGVDQLIRLAEGEKLPAHVARAPARSADGVFDLVVPALFFVLIAGTFLKAMLGRLPGSAVTGFALGAIAWFMFGLAIASVAALLGFIIAFANTGGVGRGGSGWSSGRGGAWGGSSGGSSSWGGGGGGFGGGGASGRW